MEAQALGGRRLAAGAPLSAIEAMRPKPVGEPPTQPFNYPTPKMREGMSSIGPVGDAGASMGLVTNPAGGSFGNMIEGGMLPGMQSQGSAAVTGFVNPKSLTEGTLDPVEAAKSMSVFEKTGGKSPFGLVAPGSTAPGIPPGALANPPGFNPLMNKPKAPLWR